MNELANRKSYQVGDGQTSLYEPRETYGESVIPALQKLIKSFDELSKLIPIIPDEKAEARKRSHDDLIKKRRDLYKRGGR